MKDAFYLFSNEKSRETVTIGFRFAKVVRVQLLFSHKRSGTVN